MLDGVQVTVAIATHDRPQFLADCLASAAGGLGREDRLMVVESGRSSVADAVAGLGVPVETHRVASREKTVKMNEAIRRASTEVVLFSDDDCRFEAGWATSMGRVFADPAVGLAFGPVVGISQASGSLPPVQLPPGPAPLQPWAFAHGPSMAVRRRAAFDAGGFDERFGPGATCPAGEEADLLLRVREKGWSCVIADAPSVSHLDWRSEAQDAANFRVFALGAGAYIGAALRRAPAANAKLFALLLGHQAELWSDRAMTDPWFGPRTAGAFLRGVARGVRLPPRRWL